MLHLAMLDSSPHSPICYMPRVLSAYVNVRTEHPPKIHTELVLPQGWSCLRGAIPLFAPLCKVSQVERWQRTCNDNVLVWYLLTPGVVAFSKNSLELYCKAWVSINSHKGISACLWAYRSRANHELATSKGQGFG